MAVATGGMAEYIRTRPQADSHYEALIMDFIRAQGHVTRQDIDALLLPVLSEALTPEQKTNKISNLLTKLRRRGAIVNRGSRSNSRWTLSADVDGDGRLSDDCRKEASDDSDREGS